MSDSGGPARRLRLAAVGTVVILLTLAVTYWYQAPVRKGIAVPAFTYPADQEELQSYATLFRNELAHRLSRLLLSPLVQSPDDAQWVVRGRMTEVPDGVRLFVQVTEPDSATSLWSKTLTLPPEPTEDLLVSRPEHLATLIWWVAPLDQYASGFTESPPALRAFIAGGVEQNELSPSLGGDWNAA